VKLVSEEDQANLAAVSGVVAMKGWQLPGFIRYGRETMVGFVKAENAGAAQDPWPPLGFRPGRELWRDSHTLLQSVAEKSERPKVLSWLDDLRQQRLLNRAQVRVDAFGMSSSTAKIFFWRHETFPLPLAYLATDHPELIESLEQAIRLADRVENALRSAIWNAVATALKPGKDQKKLPKKERDEIDRVARSLDAQSLYWSRLETPFRKLILELPGGAAHREGQLRRWFEILRLKARDAYRRTAGQLESSSRALRATVVGQEGLERGLGRIATEYRFMRDSNQLEATDANA
jgi:CRISPR type I-E-associated protein CasA/Cse1